MHWDTVYSMKETQPNILLITSEQQHWNTIGKFFPEVKTPNLDRLIEKGTYFNRAYCPNPLCTPTRSSMITGQYPSAHGAWTLGTKLKEEKLTVGDLFQEEGYDVSLIGKAHFQPLMETEEYSSLECHPKLRDLDFWRNFNGPFYGFNHVELIRNHTDEAHVGQHYALWMEEKGFKDWRKHFASYWNDVDYDPENRTEPQEHSWTLPEKFHYNTWTTERSIARMERCANEGKPFFLWASYLDPHPSYLVSEPWASMYDPNEITLPERRVREHQNSPPHIQKTQMENPDFSDLQESEHENHGCHSHLKSEDQLRKDIAVYYGMVSMMDHYIGKLLDGLEATGQAENTIVVFTTDHGHYYGHHGLTAKGPFHYEDGIKVPMIVSWPGKVEKDVVSPAIQSLVDLPVSFLNAAGIKVPYHMQGMNQLSVWKGETTEVRDHAIIENRHQQTAIHMKTYVDRRYKITVYCGREYGELYDLETDPDEYENLWDKPEFSDLKSELILKFLHAEMAKEPIEMPRIAVA